MAKNREDKTGVILADLLVRTDVDSYVLGGPSLGARAMAVTAQALGSNPDGPKIEEASERHAALRLALRTACALAGSSRQRSGLCRRAARLRVGSRWTDEHDLGARPAPTHRHPVELGVTHHLSAESCVLGEQSMSTDDRSRNDPLVVV